MSKFKHELGATVKLEASDESGTVVGRVEYENDENCYWIRYLAGDGRQTKAWWNESDLSES